MKPPANVMEQIAAGKRPVFFTLARVEHYEALARRAIRDLWPSRQMIEHRRQIRGWVGTLRDARRVRIYNRWL